MLDYRFQQKEYERIIDNAEKDSLDFYLRARDSIVALQELLNHWDRNPQKYNDTFSKDYPFGSSLDEVITQGYSWLAEIIKAMDIQNETYEPTMTVGDLKKVLKQLPDDLQITVGYDKGWLNIESVSFPNEADLVTLVLNAKNTFSVFQV